MEDYIPKYSTTSTQTSKPSVVHEEFKVDPAKNFHGEPIIPKDEAIDWESLPIPELNLPIFNKPKKTKIRAAKKVKHVTLRTKTLAKTQTTVNKGDLLYICDIKEFSKINLYLDELEEVRGIDDHRHLPERLVFKYKGWKEITWPLHMILQESYSVLIKIFSSFKKNFGFNVTARKFVLKKLEDIRSNKAKDALPKTLSIPFTGNKVHVRPYWLMEFMDDKGVKRFFRLDDQLSISSNETLLEMQEKLNLSDAEELEFDRKLQNQIEENNMKLGKNPDNQGNRNHLLRLEEHLDNDCENSLDAPRLVAVLKEMKEGLDVVTIKVQALTAMVKADTLPTVNGMSYLKAKNLLLLNYCQSLVYYLLSKAKGLSIEGHPVVRSLVEIRLFLEKIRPIDKKSQYEIQKFTRIARSKEENAGLNEKEADPTQKNEDRLMNEKEADQTQKMEDPLMYRANPDMLISKTKTDEKSKVYTIPKLVPTRMEDKMTRDEKNAWRKEKQIVLQSGQSTILREIIDDREGRPEEVREMVGNESIEVTKFRERLEAQSCIEEELFTRAPLTKMQKKKMKHMKKSRNSMHFLTESFGDEIKALTFESSTAGQTSVFGNDNYKERKLKKRKVRW
ncbi:hypothetical protein AgCh_028099 [Apium graveolens]